VVGDVTDAGSVARAAREAREKLGEIDILVNNAGAAHSAPIAKISLEDWNRLFAVNATGTLLMTQALLSGMIARGWGRVINIASVAGLAGARYIGAYAASKHAVVGFTRAAAAEVAGSGVTVNAICPGYVDSEMTRETIARIVQHTGKSADEARAALVATTPERRLIDPDEVAHAVLYLCAGRARGVNGDAIVIDGGGLLS